MLRPKSEIRLGSHTSQSGHGFFADLDLGCGSGSDSPWSMSTRRKVDADTHTNCS